MNGRAGVNTSIVICALSLIGCCCVLWSTHKLSGCPELKNKQAIVAASSLCETLTIKGVRMQFGTNGIVTDYDRGVNDALDTWSLLNLELQLNEKRLTIGEMADIVRQRLNVKKWSLITNE